MIYEQTIKAAARRIASLSATEAGQTGFTTKVVKITKKGDDFVTFVDAVVETTDNAGSKTWRFPVGKPTPEDHEAARSMVWTLLEIANKGPLQTSLDGPVDLLIAWAEDHAS